LSLQQGADVVPKYLAIGAEARSYVDEQSGEEKSFNGVTVLIPVTREGEYGFKADNFRCAPSVAREVGELVAKSGPVVVDAEIHFEKMGRAYYPRVMSMKPVGVKYTLAAGRIDFGG
jgi:hypothetical protein